MFFRSKKIISMLIVFVIVFTYMGQTLEAIATTDGLSAITNGFFKDGEMKLSSYFKQDEQPNKEKISDVNEKATLILELSPNQIGKGFLKKGTILAKGFEGRDSNFKFSKIKNVLIDDLEEEVKYEGEDTKPKDKNTEENVISENVVVEGNEIINNEVIQNNTIENSLEDNVIGENTTTENVTNETIQNEVNNNVTENENSENNTVENTANSNEVSIMNHTNNEITNEVTNRSSEPRAVEEELINEQQVLEEITEETYEELTAKDFEIEIVGDNQIKVENVIYHTTIEVEIEYNKKEELDVADLYQEINLILNGTYINVNLEKIEVETQENIFVGWSYHKEFELVGEYTKFSPFKLGEHTGSIVENKISVKRETEEEKYLPIKQTTIEIDVPDWNGKAPEAVNVQATKLMATKGEDVGEVTFGKENWEYDAENKKIIIHVQNENEGKAVESVGEDEYVIVYRYRDYTEDEFVNMANNFKVTTEEYSANNNPITTKEFGNVQQIKTQINDLITYNIGSTEEKVNKAKVNANYELGTENYETEFTTSVNVNILTSDLLEEFKINSSKEAYISNNSVEVDATPDVYYKKIKFNYTEIKNLLQNGATIEVQSLSGELLYTLNDELAVNQEACEVRLESKEKGVFVVFKNVTNNGNIGIEFTKAIGKSTYEKATFNSFQEIRSYVSAELKYKNFDERYAMSEIVTSKKLENSQTNAELVLTNSNLSTTAKNDHVEARIVLNNDKLNTDIYKNPSFELVFPQYVTDVTVANIGLIYGCGLKIANFEIYKEDGFVKMRIEATGVQTAFCESVITNGTNIILNLNLTLEEYTPKKQDQIKMYYYNEAVTNYTAQTKWTMKNSIPNGILKETNGFDVAVVNYQAPNGLITSNAIVNYDGHGSKIKSIGQGEKTVQVETSKEAQIATMELVAMNNTGNKCSEAIFLGRVPFEGNKSIMTGKDLGTTKTAKLLIGIKESETNSNRATIYYSQNENATKDLNDTKNGWTTDIADWQNIKSYMIVVDGEIEAGTILKYHYDFEIPENLGYEEKLYGSFGGYYNNQYSTMIAYENSEADKVGVVTENTPELKVTVLPYGENTNLYYGQVVSLVAKVENNTSENINNSTLRVSVPTGTVYTELGYYTQEEDAGVYEEFLDNYSITYQDFNIDSLEVGEVKNFQFKVKVLDSQEDSTRLAGTAELNGITQKYQLKASKSKIAVEASVPVGVNLYKEGDLVLYYVNINNQSNEIAKDVNLQFTLPNYITLSKIQVENGETMDELNYKITDKGVIAKIGDISEQTKRLIILAKVEGLNVENSNVNTIFNAYEESDENKTYSSNVVSYRTEKAYVDVTQFINSDTFNYSDQFEYRITIKNNSNIADFIKITSQYDEHIYFEEAKIIINGEEKELKIYNDINRYEHLAENGMIEIIAKGKILDSKRENKDLDLSSVVTVKLSSNEEIHSNEIRAKVHKTPEKQEEGSSDLVDENIVNIEKTEEPKETYSISGNVYVDADANGFKTEQDKNLKSQVQVQLLKGSNMVKATTTDSIGNYLFTDLEPGDYSIVYNYDKQNYTSAQYIETQGTTNQISNTIETEEGIAVTDNISITNSSIENVDAGLQEKDKFDFEIKQYIEQVIVNIKGNETKYAYDSLSLAKAEIDPSDIKNATVKLKYKIVVTNVGNVEGQVTSIVDYLPNGVIFNQAENEEWSIGVIKGNVYYDGLKGINLLPGESREVSLILNKKMTEDNTGVISNKAQIAYTESATRLTEAIEGNFATQETIITVNQGSNHGLKVIITTVSFTGIIGLFGYMIKTGKLEKKFNGKKWIKKVYK